MVALKNCPHDKSEHTKNVDGYSVCKACARERMRERRKNNARVGRGINNASKTHCPKQHEYTPDNTIIVKGWKNGKRRCCRQCAREHMREVVIKQYGITIEQYDEMFLAQGGRCRICPAEFTKNPHIDHDHSCCPGRKSCGKCVRGLLCGDCNKGLGCFKDSPVILRSALEYLEAKYTKQH